MSEKVIEFPQDKAPDFMIGPFEEYRVVVEGRLIPNLTAFTEGDNIFLVVDHRFSVSFPKDRAYNAAWLIANAMAVAAGYAYLGSDNKERPFAPECSEIKTPGSKP